MKSKIVFIEDENKMAKAYFKRLGLKNTMQAVYFKNLTQMKALMHTYEAKSLYWVDINLGRGRTNEGIEVIKTIKKNDPDAFIIVYSAYPAKENACMEAGANFFFKKNPISYEDDLLKIRGLIITLIGLQDKKEPWEKSTTLYCQIVKIEKERNLVHLNCKNNLDSKETFKKVFPLNHFKDKEKLSIKEPMLVQIFERPGEVRFLFEAGEADYFKHEDDTYSAHPCRLHLP